MDRTCVNVTHDVICGHPVSQHDSGGCCKAMRCPCSKLETIPDTITADWLSHRTWACCNMPKDWDFRNKSQKDLDEICFGTFVNQDQKSVCSIRFGGLPRAETAKLELSKLGIESVIQAWGERGNLRSVCFRLGSSTQDEFDPTEPKAAKEINPEPGKAKQ